MSRIKSSNTSTSISVRGDVRQVTNCTNCPQTWKLFDYHLTRTSSAGTSSPCIDAGSNLAGQSSRDVEWLARPQCIFGSGNGCYDVGAYEAQ